MVIVAMNPSKQDSLLLFYMTQETPNLAGDAKHYKVVDYPLEQGDSVKKPALRITIPTDTPIYKPCKLLTFGSDAQRCNIILPASGDISHIHCTVFAQLNSGPDVFVIEGNPSRVTYVIGHVSAANSTHKTILGHRRVVEGLYAIKIGAYVFRFRPCMDQKERTCRDMWFRDHEFVPITKTMLETQLRGETPASLPINKLGEGGNGKVIRHVEKTAGLLIAIKQIFVLQGSNEDHVCKEIDFMKRLNHISRSCVRKIGLMKPTAKPGPLYPPQQGNPSARSHLEHHYASVQRIFSDDHR